MIWRRRLEWDTHRLGWWVAVLFMLGSTCFALGSLPAYVSRLDPAVVGMTFFVGSIFFTSAAGGQFIQGVHEENEADGETRLWRPGSLLWWAGGVQFIGTLFFNRSTFHAMSEGLSTSEANHLVWAPDFFGSIAFLVASHLAWLLVCGRLWCVRTDDDDWWISALNYAGSIFFMLSAIGAVTLPTTGNVANLTLVNTGTFLGAIGFFVGAYLLLPAARPPTVPT